MENFEITLKLTNSEFTEIDIALVFVQNDVKRILSEHHVDKAVEAYLKRRIDEIESLRLKIADSIVCYVS